MDSQLEQPGAAALTSAIGALSVIADHVLAQQLDEHPASRLARRLRVDSEQGAATLSGRLKEVVADLRLLLGEPGAGRAARA